MRGFHAKNMYESLARLRPWLLGHLRRQHLCRVFLSGIALACNVAWPSSGVAQPTTGADSARRAVERAAELIGGMDALGAIRTIQREYVTLWYRPTYDGSVADFTRLGSVEYNVDSRDYSRQAWRQERRFHGWDGPAGITNVVSDSVAMMTLNGSSQPQSAAYLEERDELFVMSPEFLLPRLLRDSSAGFQFEADSLLDGALHRRVICHWSGRSVSLWLTRSGYLAGVRFTSQQPLDFGLAGLGAMQVEVRFGAWRKTADVVLPYSVLVFRAGAPYKQLISRATTAPAKLDDGAFDVPGGVRLAFEPARHRPMFDIPQDSIDALPGGVVAFRSRGAIPGAVRLRGGWLLLGAGAAPLQAERAFDFLSKRGLPVAAALLYGTSPTTVGGAAALASHGVSLVVPRRSGSLALRTLAGLSQRPRMSIATASGSWLTIAQDSVYVEELDIPDATGAVMLWVPRLEWAFLTPLAPGFQMRGGLAALERRGFHPKWIGTFQRLSAPAPEVVEESRTR